MVPTRTSGTSRSEEVNSLMKLAVRPTTLTSERNCTARRAVKVTPRAPSWGDWKRILRGMPASKSVMRESLGRGLSALRTVRVGRRGRGNGIDGKGVVDGILKNICLEQVHVLWNEYPELLSFFFFSFLLLPEDEGYIERNE